ncbi:MAG: DEAD/DEAH box helicase [Archaeoglobaceae archaeon]
MISETLSQILKEAGIEELTVLQEEASQRIGENKDVLIIAPTGSGKTEAAMIPLFNQISTPDKGIVLLYITPLRALNRDMLRRLKTIAGKLGLSIAVRHGDTPNSERRKQALKPPQILVTTPETLQILFLGKRLKEALKRVRFVVVDEIHEMADSERGAQLSLALQRLMELTRFQTIGLSATVKNPHRVAAFLSDNAEVISSQEEKLYSYSVTKPKIEQEDEKLSEELFIDPDVAAQIRTIKEIVEKHKSTLIFVNTRTTAEALGIKLKKLIDVEVHHGSLSKEARIDSEDKFASGELKALICTSSMELGMDIGHVDAVIQFNSPRQVARLIQRVGRSGHKAGRISRGYIITGSFDDILESWIITDMAEKGLIEDVEFHFLSLDTLANQIAAIAMENGEIEVERAYRMIQRGYLFRTLDYEEFAEICDFLSNMNIIYFDGERIATRRKTRTYFYDNISMIPDEKNYQVYDITTGKRIGTVDESFLSTFVGDVFAIRGELWRVVSVEDSVKVEPVTGEGEIPSWVGEEIPVPFEVAQKVGELRERIGEQLKASSKEQTIESLAEDFRTNEEACREVVEVMEKQLKNGFVIPSNKDITIESSRNVAIINACFGHRVNETIGRIVALLLSARKASNVSVEVNPYRIKLTPTNASEVEEVLHSIRHDSIESLAERSLIDTKLLQWKVIKAARKFGYLRKDYDLSKLNLKKFVMKFKDTPIWREAVRELFIEKMDVDTTTDIFSSFDEFCVTTYSQISPISLASREHAFDLIMPARPTSAILNVFKKRLESEMCIMHCINCGATIRSTVNLIEEPSCPRCKSKLVACINGRRKLEEFSKQELFRIANLVMAYGKKTVYAMNTHGVGADSAARILSKYYPDQDSFFKELLNAEKNYIRTRRFWG